MTILLGRNHDFFLTKLTAVIYTNATEIVILPNAFSSVHTGAIV